MRRGSPWLVLGSLIFVTGSCRPKATLQETSAAAEPEQVSSATDQEVPPRLVATIRELMDAEVDPAADFLWDAVASINGKGGLVERQPRTDEEWHEVRRHAITLIEATNLLTMKGRRVSRTYIPAANDEELDTTEVQQKIDGQRGVFIAYAQGLQAQGLSALAAIDARNPAALFDVGSTIDEACESCHVMFWYPKRRLPPVE